MNIAIGADHAGFHMKEQVKAYLITKGYKIKDFGAYSEDRVDYADFAHAVANSVENNECSLGIILCGSGNGINMAANRHKGIRSAICWNEEIAKMARLHNDANVIALPSRYISEDTAKKCIDTFIATEFEGGRHTDRINKINC